MSKTIEVRGEEKAVAVIERAGLRAENQQGSLREASQVHAIRQGAWQNQSGKLTGSLDDTQIDPESLTYVSEVPYARYVFYGTVTQGARPPKINKRALTDAVVQRVAKDLVGE